MKKIILTLSLLTTLLLSEEIPKEKINSIFTFEKTKIELPDLEESFTKDTGDYNFDKYLKESVKDYDWKLANYLYKFEKEPSKMNYNNKEIVLMTPKYNEALELFAKSAEKGNVLSAYEGLLILEKHFIMIGENKIAKKYLNVFSSVLKDKNYCVGYLYNGRSYMKKYTEKHDYNKAKEIVELGLKKCNTKNIPNYYITGLKQELVKISTMIKAEKAKELRKNSGAIQE